MKKNSGLEEPSKSPQAFNRSSKRMRSYKSQPGSRKRLSYKIDIPPEPEDTSTAIQKKFLDLYDGLGFGIFMAVVTLYALFADDVRQIAFPPSADLTFTVINLLCISIFVLQLVLLSIFKDGYFLKFYFWLDLISTGTMLLDLVWISDLMSIGQATNATNVIQIARAGRVSKLGARTARFIRIIRLIRMLRLYKNASAAMASEQDKRVSLSKPDAAQIRRISDLNQVAAHDSIKEDNILEDDPKEDGHIEQPTMEKWEFDKTELKRNKLKLPPIKRPQKLQLEQFDKTPKVEQKKQVTIEVQPSEHSSQKKVQYPEQSYNDPMETKVGAKLKDEIQKNIILMVLLVLVSVPMFTSDTWIQQITVYNRGINQIQSFSETTNSSTSIESSLRIFIEMGMNLSSPLVYLSYPINKTCCTFPDDFQYHNVTPITSLRVGSVVNTDNNSIVAIFDRTEQDILSSKLNIGRTLFICVIIVVFSLLFTRDVEQYALEPLENMLSTVKRISENPLQAIIAIQNENIIKSTIKENEQDDSERKKTEPVILADMIVKIGALLAVGFGEAGSEIIAKNIENHGAVNAVLQGKKIMAVFGFCDIRNFTDATEVLQTKVMNFVNDIAAIVHGVVNRCAGSANKNIGDAFLLVWKFKEKETIISEVEGQTTVSLRKIAKVRQIADLAVYSFIKIIAEITKSHVLQKYKRNEKLKNRIKDYQGVRMGFGLHVGWAIEGGIGSQFKIDASYLSPNVNMSSRLQAATKQFGTSLLISGELAELMTPKNKEVLRKIDCVTVKGSVQPIELFTVDLSIANLAQNIIIKERPSKLNELQKKKIKIMSNIVRQNLLEKLETSKRITQNLFFGDQDVSYLREPYTSEFYNIWRDGLDAYISGDWRVALTAFKKTHTMLGDIKDGPSQTLIDVIQSFRGEAPANWKGFRQLTQK